MAGTLRGAALDQLHVLFARRRNGELCRQRLAKFVTNGEHGVALFNSERQLMWARAAQNLSLAPGVHVLSHTFPSLPLRPGTYQWQVSLWDNGEMLDLWDCIPEMTIATDVHQHYMDEWNGIFNLPSSLPVRFRRKARLSEPRVFDLEHYDLLNCARADVASQLLAEQQPQLNLQTAIDVGCGLGYFSQLLKSTGSSRHRC